MQDADFTAYYARARRARTKFAWDGLESGFKAQNLRGAGWYEIVSRPIPGSPPRRSASRAVVSRRANGRARSRPTTVPDFLERLRRAQPARIRASPSERRRTSPPPTICWPGRHRFSSRSRSRRTTRAAPDRGAGVARSRCRAPGGAFDDGRASLLGTGSSERDLRFGVERSYREFARPAGPEIPSGSSSSIAPIEVRQGHRHDHRGVRCEHEDVDMTTQPTRLVPFRVEPLFQAERSVLRAIRRPDKREGPKPDASATRSSSTSRSRPHVSDRACAHHRNEDSFHLEVDGERNVAAVVCDRISSASAGNVAARNAAEAAGVDPRAGASRIRTRTPSKAILDAIQAAVDAVDPGRVDDTGQARGPVVHARLSGVPRRRDHRRLRSATAAPTGSIARGPPADGRRLVRRGGDRQGAC